MTCELMLSITEAAELAQHEATIERGLKTFVDVGQALLSIRDARLYRAQWGTFEDYCRERWQMTHRNANRMIAAAEVTGNLGPIGPTPATESQARPLTQLKEPEQQINAWQRAVETAPNGKITAAHVQTVVNEITGKTQPEPVAPVVTEQITPPMAVHFSSESPEWYTPQHILDCTITAMGGIDLDPCSNSHESPNVPAAIHFTQDDNGLIHSWTGRVYMNPPYGREIIDWVQHFFDEYKAGHMTEGIALLPARTDTEWFRILREYPRCFVWGRLRFSNNENGAPFPSMVVYLGTNIQQFANAFKAIGDIYQLVEA